MGFRPATEDDVPFLLELRRQTMAAHQMKSGLVPSQQERLERVRANFEWAQIIMKADQPIGLLKAVSEGQAWELVQIQLKPSDQGKGLGTTILRLLISEAREANASLRLSVLRASPARHLYERLGFVVVAEKLRSYEMVLEV